MLLQKPKHKISNLEGIEATPTNDIIDRKFLMKKRSTKNKPKIKLQIDFKGTIG